MPTEPTRRALCIGINAYGEDPDIKPLKGCVNDVEAMATLLQDRYGFTKIEKLLDHDATKQNILDAFDRLVTETADGDVVVVQYSGHGSFATDQRGGSASGNFSTIVPVDSGRDKVLPQRDIFDFQINKRLRALCAKTPHVTLIFDSCHSGTITRDAELQAATRSVPSFVITDETKLDESPPSAPKRAATRGLGDAAPTIGTSDDIGSRYVVISGCRDAEKSREYPVAASPTEPAHGALTYYLLQELQTPTVRSYAELYAAVHPRVTAYCADQHPQIEGRKDAQVFGTTTLDGVPYVRVLGPSNTPEAAGVMVDPGVGTIYLEVGALQQATAGSEYEIHAPGRENPSPGSFLARVRLDTIGATRSEATVLVLGDKPIPLAARAIEVKHALGGVAPRVWLDASVDAQGGANAEDLRKLLAGRSELVLADKDSASVRVSVENGSWMMRGEGDRMVGPPIPLDGVAMFADNLVRFARRQSLLALNNTSLSRLNGAVTLELLRRVPGPDGKKIYQVAAPNEQTGQVEFYTGEQIAFRIVHQADKALFVNLLFASADGEIVSLEPWSSNAVQQVPPGVPFIVYHPTAAGSTDPEKGFAIRASTTFKFMSDGATVLHETVKLIASVRETSFGAYVQGPMQVSATRSDAPSDRFDDPDQPDDDWTAVEARYVNMQKPIPFGVAPAVVAAKASGSGELPAGLATALGTSGAARDIGEAVLRERELGVQRRVVLTSDATAAARAVDTPVPPQGHGQMLLVTDPDGLVSWKFASAEDKDVAVPAPPGSRAAGTVWRYQVETPAPDAKPAAAPGSRSIASAIVKQVVESIVFPLITDAIAANAPVYAERFESRAFPYRLRTFKPDDYATPNGEERSASELLGGRALLMVHGTFSRAHAAFGALPADVVKELHRAYNGRVFAFDHYSLSHDPKRNVEWLLSTLPADKTLELDIVCHSRGGLVARTLAECYPDRVRVRRVVFVGAANDGTVLADPEYMAHLLDTMTNLLKLVPTNGLTEALDGVLTVAKLLAQGLGEGLEGIKAMRPGGDFLTKTLGGTPTFADGAVPRYFAMSSNYSATTGGFTRRLADRLTDRVFKNAPNDLVVPTASAYSLRATSPLFPIGETERRVFEGSDSMIHTEFFGQPAVYEQLQRWLLA